MDGDSSSHSTDSNLERQETMVTMGSEKQTSKEAFVKLSNCKENSKGAFDSSEMESEISREEETPSQETQDHKHGDCAAILPPRDNSILDSPGEMVCENLTCSAHSCCGKMIFAYLCKLCYKSLWGLPF